jgi:hypothetical protein
MLVPGRYGERFRHELGCSSGAIGRSEFSGGGRERGPKELSDQGAGIVETFDLLAGKLCEGRFSPISDEFDGVEEVFFL